MEATGTGASGMTTVPSLAQKQKQAQAATTSITDCCICSSLELRSALGYKLTSFLSGLYPVTVCQALFIAPCSHVTVSCDSAARSTRRADPFRTR